MGKAETERPAAAASLSSACFPLPAAKTVDLDTFI